jgi:LEA14-like dessication related protein
MVTSMQQPFRGPRAVHIAAALSLLLAGCESLGPLLDSAPKPTARVVAVNLQNITLDKVDLVFALEVSNPYSVNLPLLDLGYAIGSGGNRLFEGTVKPSGSIPAGGKQIIQLPAIVQFAPLMQTLKNVRPGSVVPYKADFMLGVETPLLGRVDVPLSKTGEFPVPAMPEVEMASFGIGTLTLDQVSAMASLQIKNTNQFPLDLTKLGVSLSLAGQDVARTSLARAISLAPGQSATLEMPVAFAPRKFGGGLFNLLRSNQIAYKVAGSVEAKSRFGPIALPYSYVGNTRIIK